MLRVKDVGGCSCKRGILHPPLYSMSCKFLEKHKASPRRWIIPRCGSALWFLPNRTELGCTEVLRHRTTHAFFIKDGSWKAVRSRIAVTYFVLNTPCIFHNKKCFLSTSFVDARTREGSRAVPPTRDVRKWRCSSEALMLTVCFYTCIMNLNRSHLKSRSQKQYCIIDISI